MPHATSDNDNVRTIGMDMDMDRDPETNSQTDAPTNNSTRDMDEEALLRRMIDDPAFKIPDISELVGEKADDAIDFEDISDTELPDEEESTTLPQHNGDGDLNAALQQELEIMNDADNADTDMVDDLFGDDDPNDIDHLFGDANESDPMDMEMTTLETQDGNLLPSTKATLVFPSNKTITNITESKMIEGEDEGEPEPEDEEPEDPKLRQQMLLIEMSKKKAQRAQKLLRGEALDEEDDLPPVPETDVDLVERLWPRYHSDQTPRFVDLFAPKKADYVGKIPLRPPKVLQLQKVALELEPDQERSFNLTSSNMKKRKRESTNEYGLTYINSVIEQQDEDDTISEPDVLDDSELIGNITIGDIRMLCENWEHDLISNQLKANLIEAYGVKDANDIDYLERVQEAKKRRILYNDQKTLPEYVDDFKSFEDPEQLTSKIAASVYLDLNDPLLLLEPHQPNSSKQWNRSKIDYRDSGTNVRKAFDKKWNFSNDEDYDLLKENHSNKVRSSLASVALEHSMPAVKLQYPFYKVKLDPQETRAFHRPNFGFPVTSVKFEQLARLKSKNMRGLDVKTAFKYSDDLSMADNSQMLLVEYSEEYPMMLSNFGMGSKLINYYRRKDEEDRARPKRDIGETQVLLPQDKSPFSIFGNVDAGTITQTFHNAMYRCPIFKHQPKSTDFLCIRASKGGTAKWYLRNIDNLFIAGQQFPSMQIPGTHSRKVTDASKRRLRMIAYRMYKKNSDRRNKDPLLSNDMMKEHLLGADTGAVRSKMREFMVYDKQRTSWNPKPGEMVPSEEIMRSWIKPEDICVLDSMQVGDQHLRDVGFNRDDTGIDQEEDEKEGASLDERLAPWFVTKHFLEACQGKAMLELHGEGDPTGRGEGFSLLKTSMKGGFKAIGESVNDKLDAKRQKELGGHAYNVKLQEKAYIDAINRIWNLQQESLSSTHEHALVEADLDEREYQQEEFEQHNKTPRSIGTPSIRHTQQDDETSSMFSKFSSNSQHNGKSIRIIRNHSGSDEPEIEIVTDPKVIQAYMKRRRAIEIQKMSLEDLKPTGNADEDQRRQKALLAELQRLQHNQERRHARERLKAADLPTTPGTPGDIVSQPSKSTGTTRKCANCGQIGHIKTNKKACPLLNGQMKMEQNGFNDSAFGPITTTTPTLSAVGGGPTITTSEPTSDTLIVPETPTNLVSDD